MPDPTDEQLVATLVGLGCAEPHARQRVAEQRDGAAQIHAVVARAAAGDVRANDQVTGMRTWFAFRFNLKATP